MKRKNLEKAIIMGLLAASISVPVWAEDTETGALWTDANKTVSEGNLIVNAGGNVGVGFQGTVNVVNGNLTVNTDSNGILAGYAKDATVNILANNITINSGENGIFTTWGDNFLDAIFNGYRGNVNIGSSDRKVESLYINAGGQGIDNKLGNVNIYGSKDSIISIKTDSTGGEMENQDGILNESGQVVIEGGNVIVSADYGYGINNNSTKVDIDAAGSVSIVSKDNPIDGKDPIVNAGINNTTGITEITAEKGITVESTHNGIYATGGTVKFDSGTKNKINAVDHGIYATGKNTQVTLSAENHEIYVNNNSGEPDGVAKGVHAVDGTTEEINSDNNTSIIVEGNVADIIGVHAEKGGTVNINTGSLNMEVTAEHLRDRHVIGIIAGDYDHNVTSTKHSAVNVDAEDDISINVYGVDVDTYAVQANNNGEINLTSHNGNIEINAVDNVEKYVGATKYGVYTGMGGNVDIVAENGSVTITSGDSETYRGNNYGIESYGETNITAKNDITVKSYSDGTGTIYGGEGVLVNGGLLKAEAGGKFTVYSESNLDQINSRNYGIDLGGQGTVDIDAATVDINSKGNYISTAIYEVGNSNLNLDAKVGDINVTAEAKGSNGRATLLQINGSTAKLNANNNMFLIAKSEDGQAQGIWVKNGDTDLNAVNGSTVITANGRKSDSYGVVVETDSNGSTSTLDITSNISNIIYGTQNAVYVKGQEAATTITADIGSNFLSADVVAVKAHDGATIDVISNNNSNLIVSDTDAGILSFKGSDVNVTANKGYNVIESLQSSGICSADADTNVVLTAIDNQISASYGIYAYTNGATELNASNSNRIFSSQSGIFATSNADVDLNAQKGYNFVESDASAAIYSSDAEVDLTSMRNQVIAAETNGFGSVHAIKADSTATVDLNATAGDNVLAGVIYAKDDFTNVTLEHNIKNEAGIVIKKGSGSNYIYSSAHGSTDGVSDRSHVVAALYAQNKGQIDITAGEGGINHIETSYTDLDDSETSTDSERTIWAQRGGKVNIEGTTIIKSSNAEDFYDEEGYATNSRGVAITAGSGVALADKDHGYTDANGNKHAFFENGVLADVDKVLGYRSEVNLNYGAGSAIYGDIVSGYGGSVNISTANENSGLYMEGNALAGNGGKLTLDIGKGGTWFGRADDYGDAGYGEDAQHKQNYYNPVFSDTIYTGGTVDIKMGEGSTWYLTGQSWVSSLDVSKGNGNVTIDMQEFNEGTHGLTIAEMTGKNDGTIDATFVMSLNHDDHGTSDMLYIKNGTGEYDVVLKEAIDGMENINADNVLRFATVHGGAQFNSVTMDNVGLYNLGFEIDHSEYDTAETTENQGYNGTSVDENKPGNENVEGFFDLDETAADEGPSNIMLLADQNQRADDSVQNWFITRVSGQEISDGGKTVVNMSKVNYSNAVYMDRLNKRLGEARYINNEEDQGMWVRMRHDRIGKDNEFRIMNTMYELGYDEKQECDNGERRVGAAIDYMDGSSEYTGVGGSGDVSRKGIWLYDTWLGDKGHYSDFVAKWGHLSNDFTLYRGGDKITGDFSNNVYSISAEYGRKKDIGNNWYFEPQVQLQYARVTDANYTTSQGTEVSLDAINSLIARAGFRLGKDLGERSTVYFKADVLHEFLGDQDIYATDGTGTMDVTYGNEGTWCDIGFGFATAMSKTSYAYLDVETSLGNDYEETYQINAGLQWSF